MAYNLNYAAALLQAQMAQISAQIGAAAKLWIYDGAQPSGPSVAATPGTLVAGPFTLGTPFAPAPTLAVPSVVTMTNPVASVNATKTSQPTWFRITDAAGIVNDPGIIDGSAGPSNADMIVGPCTVTYPVTVTGANTFVSGT